VRALFVLPPFCQKNGVPRSKGEKTSEKVARLAEKQYLCGRKAFQLNNHIADTE